MPPITGVVEKKVFESAWNFLTGWLTRYRDMEKKYEDLKEKYELLQHELAEERSPRLAFEKLMSELECHHEDENIYWRKDGKGGPYCGVCLNHDQKLTPMTHAGEGAFYCCIHKQYFRTKECREREENRPQPKQPSYGEHGWMAR